MSENQKNKNDKNKLNNKNIEYFCKFAGLKLNRKDIEEWEVYGNQYSHNEIEIFKGEIENLTFADTFGIGIRIFKDKKIGYSYTSNMEESALDSCIQKAIENALISDPDENNFLPREEEYLYKMESLNPEILFSEKFNEFSTEDKIKIAKNLETIALKKDKRVSAVSDLIYEDSISRVAMVNSNDFYGDFKTSSAFIYIGIISKENDDDISTGDYFEYKRDPSLFNIEEIAGHAVKRSTMLLGSKKIKSLKADLVLDPFVSAQILQIIASILSADAVQKGKSLFKNKLGEKIFSKDINIIDDGIMPSGLSTQPFDGEGVPRGRTIIFNNGILKNYLYNTYTARKDKVKSTGNAARSSYQATPEVGVSNFYMEPGIHSFEELIKKIDKGFYILDIIGLHSGTNPISGQVSVGAKGIWIEKGSLTFPVKEVTIATDILSLCNSLAEAGRDLKFLPSSGYIGAPSLVFKDITISGK